METRIDNKECDYCGEVLNYELYELTHTHHGHDFCNYLCMKNFYDNDIPDNEDFISVAI